MKNYLMIIVFIIFIIVIAISFYLGFISGRNQVMNYVENNLANKNDMNKVIDKSYLDGLKDGTHCAVLEDKGGNPQKDERCISATNRVLQMSF